MKQISILFNKMKSELTVLQIDSMLSSRLVTVIFFGYLLFLLNKISNQLEKNSEIGRYQLENNGHYRVIDTKTGSFKVYDHEFNQIK